MIRLSSSPHRLRSGITDGQVSLIDVRGQAGVVTSLVDVRGQASVGTEVGRRPERGRAIVRTGLGRDRNETSFAEDTNPLLRVS